MSASEVNFTFNGLHCLRDFGCVFIEESTRIVTPEREIDEYTIAGHSGTILMGEKENRKAYSIRGVLVPMQTPRSKTEEQALCRRISEWLHSGRQMLTWDYEPDHMHMADVVDAIEWETNTWMEGGILIRLHIQPDTYDIQASIGRKSVSAGTSSLSVPVLSPIPCPVSLEITATGAIGSVRVTTPEGKSAAFSGMAMKSGDVLRISMDVPIGATITSGGIETNALRYATQFDRLEITNGKPLDVITDGPADIVARARGCRP